MKTHTRVFRPTLLTLLLAFAFPACTSLQNSTAENQPPGFDIVDIENQIHESINDFRSLRGLPPLRINTSISSVARSHSSAMATGREPFSHNNADRRFNQIRDLFDAGRISENVAFSTTQPNMAGAIVDGWLRSEHHLEAILGPYSSTGIAVSRSRDGRYFVTQICVAEKGDERGELM